MRGRGEEGLGRSRRATEAHRVTRGRDGNRYHDAECARGASGPRHHRGGEKLHPLITVGSFLSTGTATWVIGRPDSMPSQRVHVRVMYATIRRPWLNNHLSSAREGDEGIWVVVGPASDLPVHASELPPLVTVGWAGPHDDNKTAKGPGRSGREGRALAPGPADTRLGVAT